MLNRFIEQLSNEMGWVEPVEKEEDDSYHVTFEPNVHVTIKQNNDNQMTFFSPLGKVKEENQESFFLKLMKANLLGKETGNGFLGLDKNGLEVNFTYFLLGHLNYKVFKEALEDFINYADVWKEEIHKKSE